MEKKWLNECCRFTAILIIAMIIEIVVFNWTNLLSIVENREEVFFGDAILENQPGEIFILNSDMKIYNVVVNCHVKGDLVFSYLKPDGEVVSKLMNQYGKNTYTLRLGCNVVGTTVLRGEFDEKHLGEVSVTYNRESLMLSPWRIIAILLIYYIGRMLFGLQKMPNYSKMMSEQL